jgi:hypothetical protein
MPDTVPDATTTMKLSPEVYPLPKSEVKPAHLSEPIHSADVAATDPPAERVLGLSSSPYRTYV